MTPITHFSSKITHKFVSKILYTYSHIPIQKCFLIIHKVLSRVFTYLYPYEDSLTWSHELYHASFYMSIGNHPFSEKTTNLYRKKVRKIFSFFTEALLTVLSETNSYYLWRQKDEWDFLRLSSELVCLFSYIYLSLYLYFLLISYIINSFGLLEDI